jgi:TolB-like protein/cytochrome c-type biogenesis protein CcmH/NrfG/predicted Ser/Thr protein kinase
MTNTSRVCPKCGATVFADAPQGCCSVCLVRTGLASLDNENDEASEPTIARMLKDFGDYELLQEIGRGGQGVVYRARQKSLNRIVALKVIGLAHWATEVHVRRFRLEAEAAARLNHPCIVPIYEVGERDGACYFSMGLVEGGQLDAVTKGEPMPIRHAAELIAKLARTVHYAHEHGILHRDIKPGNILLDATGEPHLTDFGLARLIETESTVTRTLEVLGTPSYMAPEQAVGNNERVSSATDIYGLGAVLYQLITGHPPFAGGTTFETVRLVLDTEPRQPRLWNPKVNRDLATICLKCLDKDPQRRYSSALALAEDLERWLKHEPIGARRTGIVTRGRKWVRRNPTSALLAASLVALATAIGALALALPFYWHRNVTTSLPPEKSIAVLPFENLSKDEENAFFAGGVQDEILTNLAKIADLKVISRSSVMQYKSGVPRNLKDIAQQLGVTNVLEGSVRRAGSQVRVSVQLIDARTDTHVWAEHYDRNFADIFAVHSEIARQIADQLKANLSPAEKAAIAQRPTTDLVAYTYYTKAKQIYIYGNWEGAENEKAAKQKVELLEKATQRDPNFALAYCALAKAQIDLENFELAKKAAETALRLRPDLVEPHLALARYYWIAADSIIGVDEEASRDQARDELAIVRRMSPNNAEGLLIDATVGRHQNRWDASLADLQKASELDPRNSEIAYRLEQIYFEMRRYSELEQFIRKQAPNWAERAGVEDPFNWLAMMKLAQGDPVAAQSLLEQVPPEYSPGGWIWRIRFKTALCLRDYDAANRVIAATPAKFADEAFGGPSDWAEGQVARARGDKQKAMAAFATAREKREAQQGGKPKDAPYFADIAKLDAGLGRKEEAIREGRRAVELQPITKDSLNGPAWVANLALVCAWTGERDRALEQLEKVATLPGDWHDAVTYGDLLLNPCWDDLRSDKRFDKIVAAAKAASKYALEPLPEKSIAVLPFQNLSKDEENAFFAGGVQDEILTNLAKIADLKVISRTSVMKYKSDLERNLREIAKTLGVSHVVEGSVQRAGGRVRVSAQLIDARSDAHLWAEHYDRDVADVFAIQTEIAQQIANQLQAKLSAAEKAAIAERPTADPVAYALYTKAREIDIYGNWEGVDKSLNQKVELLEKATQRDPNFALAYCALAKTQCDLDNGDPKQLELAKKAADAALRVRPDLGEAHLELARYYYYANLHTGDFDRARDEVTITLRKLPNSSEAIVIAARIDKRQNRWDDALANFQKASELDPRNDEVAFYRRRTLLEMRRYKELEQLFAKDAASGLLRDPGTQLWLAEVKLAEGDPVAAQSLLAQVPLEFSPIEWVWKIRFTAALYLRDYDAANRVIAATPAKFAFVHDGQPPESWADGQIARARGDKQKALAVFAAARKRLDATWENKVKHESYFEEAAGLDAGLGRKEEAIREAQRAVDLMPIAKDSYWGPGAVANLALVYAWTGERDRALEQLELVAKIPAATTCPGGTYGDLRFNPCWDDLRGDKRFDKIVAAAKAASR